MNYTIRVAQQEDMNQVHKLITELAIFEKEPHEVEVTIDDLKRDGFGEHQMFHCFVAEKDSVIVGIALCYPRYSTWKGKTIHLEDLIVKESMRGMGIGNALLDEVVKYGFNMGVKRIEWAVLDWNESAIASYEKKGARVMRDWDTVQLTKEGIDRYMAKL